MAVERYGSKTDVIVKLVLVFFISLLSFSIGTFVGKKFSDNQHKISQLEPQANDRELASVNPEESEVKPKDALNDEEIKKLAEEFVNDDESKKPEGMHPTEASIGAGGAGEKSGEKMAEKPAERPTEHAAERAVAKVVEKASTPAVRVAEGKTPEPQTVEVKDPQNRIPQSLPEELASSAIGKYTVQVASYPTEIEAQKMAGSLKDKGFSAFFVSAKIKDKAANTEKTWFRVSVGVFTTQKEAEAYRNDLLARAKVSSAIVQKITK